MNPLIPTVHSADPAAHVWPGDDRLWIYASHDQPRTNTHDTMISYHVFSSSDLVNWTDYGVVLHLKDVSWALSHMWAIDAVLWKGTYYLVFCAFEKATGMMRTGLATSSRPQGPFTDIGFVQGVEWGQDPTLFIDDDEQPYLFWGWGKRILCCKLTDDLRSALPGTTVELTEQLTWCFEGPWVHKYKGNYYLSYPGLLNDQWPEQMFYAMAEKPQGPYTFKGSYIPLFTHQAGTNHGSITEYKGKWYAFHHSTWISHISESRSLMADYLEYNDDGTIKPIVPTVEGVAVGVAPAPSKVVLHLSAGSCEKSCGSLNGTRVSHERAGYTGEGYVTGFDKWNYSMTLMAQVGMCTKPMRYRVKIRYAAPTGPQRNKLLVNYTQIEDPEFVGGRYDRHIEYPQCADWQIKDAGIVTLQEGDNYLKIYGGSGGIDVDYVELEPVE